MPEMIELLNVYCSKIYKNLKERINADIFIERACDDQIDIDIIWNDFEYLAVLTHVQDLICAGCSTKVIANYIYKQYRRELINSAFL